MQIFIRDKFPRETALFDKASGKFRASSNVQEAHFPSTKCHEPTHRCSTSMIRLLLE